MPSFPVRTSESHPIRVDEVPIEGVPGKLGLTFAPGKRGPRGFGDGVWQRDLDQDLARLRDAFGTDVLVSLMRDHEYEMLRIADLQERATARGIRVRRFAITDVSAPAEADREAFDALIDELHGDLQDGRTVTVHCRGGLGRSGLVAACVLVRGGVAPDDAVARVRAHREGAIETSEQEDYVHDYAARLRADS